MASASPQGSKSKIKGLVGYFGLEEWYSQLSSEQKELLRGTREGLDSGRPYDVYETVDEFLSSCAASVAEEHPTFAEAIFRKALDVSSEESRFNILLKMAESFWKLTPEKGEATLDELLRYAEGSHIGFESLLRLAEIFRGPRPEKTDWLLQKALECTVDPLQQSRAFRVMAEFYQQLNDANRWYAILQQELALLPDYVKAWMADYESRKSRYPEIWGQEGVNMRPSYPALYELARIHRHRGDLPEALALCEQALRLELGAEWESEAEDLRLRMQHS